MRLSERRNYLSIVSVVASTFWKRVPGRRRKSRRCSNRLTSSVDDRFRWDRDTIIIVLLGKE